jgi:hypothetical protein
MGFRKLLIGLAGLMAAPHAAQAADHLGVACTTPPAMHCSGADCNSALITETGNAVESKTGRKFFLDYPCDLKPGEKVVFILNIHGAGSIGNWQRHYFPAMDYKEKYRLVVATPTAATITNFPGATGPGVRMWAPDADDAHLQNITQLVIAEFGAKNIKAFWLAGHSQGGMTSNRIVCSDFFKTKVDGWLSLSGGRIGAAPVVDRFGPPKADGSSPDPRPMRFPAASPTCDFSHIFETGAHEINALPETSPWAEKYACGPRQRRPDVVDDKPGWVYDTLRSGYPVWGMKARPGTAEVFVYPNCKGGRVVADVVRQDKGHTEGLEPKITETLIKMMVAAPGGKIASGG